MPVVDLISKGDFEKVAAELKPFVLFFWAEWHEPSVSEGMLGVFTALADKYKSVLFFRVEAEKVPEVSELLEISVVPTFVALHGSKVVDKVEGANPAQLSKLVKQLIETPAPSQADTASLSSSSSEDLNARLTKLTRSSPVMLFMKGNPAAPRCGFSRQIVEILQQNAIPFASFDILGDEEVRAGLKTFSDWPTFPQLYVGGEFVGGLDIIKEMVAGDTTPLGTQLGVDKLVLPPAPPSLEQRLQSLINQATVMLFMKGTPDEPRCGFSRSMVALLREHDIAFSSFDILTDEEVRAGLKTYSDWPTYPQLYAKGALLGGIDIVKEMAEAGPLKEQMDIA